MGTGLHLLNVALIIAALAGIFVWILARSAKSHARRKQELRAKILARQPWDDDKSGGRGNR